MGVELQMDRPHIVGATRYAIPESRWDEPHAATLSPEQGLLYRSNLLGADLSITNFGGGNTSAKLPETDPLTGETVEVLWVKGSGGDIGSMKLDGFSTLYLDKLLALEGRYRGPEHEDEMVAYYAHCAFNLNPRPSSIDTPLHGFAPWKHIDHVHPDSIIALAASSGGEAATRELWGDRVGWLPWRRPGFELGLWLRDFVKANPDSIGVILAGHGLVSWADDGRTCYENTIGVIADAARYLNDKLDGQPAFGGAVAAARPERERAAIAARLMPRLRGLMGSGKKLVGDFDDSPATLEFVGSRDGARLGAIGTSCPDHFLRTKIAPLTLDAGRVDDDAYLAEALDLYRASYRAYYKRNAGSADPAMRGDDPVILLVPGVGRISFAATKNAARLAGEFFANAINVMRGAEAIGGYQGLDENEAYRIEYWQLEEDKLRRMPKPDALVGRIALVTGAAGGIGAATARALLERGACVVLADRDAATLADAQAELIATFGSDNVRGSVCDVTDEMQVAESTAYAAREYGGVDILVANAGLASSAPVEETTLDIWNRNYDVLARGYFLSARDAFAVMKLHGGGSIVFIGSKNALAASANASAYCSAKAAAIHLARCLALEGAPHGIRVNTVNPDAVIRGSQIWNGDWREERAGAYGIDSGEELEAFYRDRSLLKQSVFPEDVAAAVMFFAADTAAKSTGNILNVDAGNAQAFPR